MSKFLISVLILFFIISHPYFTYSQSEKNTLELIDSLEVLLKKATNKAKLYYELSELYASNFPEKSLEYGKKALKTAIEKNNKKQQANAYCSIGYYYYDVASYDEAMIQYQKALKIDLELKNDTSIATDYNLIGTVYEAKSEYDKALEYYHKSLKINKKIDNKPVLAHNYSNIAMIYYNWGKYEDAIEHNLIAIKIDSTLNKLNSLAIGYNNIGLCYFSTNEHDKAIEYFKAALEISKKIGDEKHIGPFLNNIGLVYYRWKKYEKAVEYFQKAIDVSEKYGNVRDAVIFSLNIGSVYSYKWKNYEKAFDYFEKCEQVCIENNYTRNLSTVYLSYYKTYLFQKNYKKSLEYHELYTATKDSIFNQDSRETLEKFRAKYETEKKEQQIVLLEKDKELKDVTIKKRNTVIYAISFGFVLILILGIIILRAYKQKHKAYELINEQKNQILEKNEELNQQNEEIVTQRDEILIQKNLLEEKNTQITSSIKYAKRIQNAILPPEEWVTKSLSEHFILFIPKDIVSGDFYWATTIKNKIVIAAVDCTGHVVPGGFMSMLGIAFLNEIVNKDNTLNANEILNKLRTYTINSLHQTGKEGEAPDGMDMSLCIVNKKEMALQYSGANNPLWIIRDNELIETKADKMPIGIFRESKGSFTNHNIDLKVNDVIYLFSDGYVDQFGGEKDRKLGKSNFQKLLTDINDQAMKNQKKFLNNYFKSWRGSNKQIDDVLVIGVRI